MAVYASAANGGLRAASDGADRGGREAAMAERGEREHYRVFRVLGTRWSDNDTYGHMNNVVHYALFDTVVNGWMIAGGFLDPGGGAEVGLVVETGCRYFAEMGFPDEVTAGLRVAHLGRSSVRWEVGLFRNAEREAAAEGFFVHVWVDRATRHPVPVPGPLRAALEGLVSG
jgi:acyl-CoA thioester hydrolase